jgi:hypothetical protein
MARDELRNVLEDAHRGLYLVRFRAVNPSGNTIDRVGYVIGLEGDGRIRFREGDPVRGPVHEFEPRDILAVERVHGATRREGGSGRREPGAP